MSSAMFDLVLQATLDTLYMVAVSGVIATLLGLPLGVLLYELLTGTTPFTEKRLRRLRELTFGIVGLGRIGTATALRAKPAPARTTAPQAAE